ncbi:MAG: class I SAM-dependent methyltransferase [Melioribacteraceae bacterium]|nr:class I SAM-dependent methyltransferase [Melioribacteraceae bacterium]
MQDKKHWYDGFFYDRFIAPNQDKIYSSINKIVQKDSNVLDFGCGTGRLTLQLAEKCKSVAAVDLSIKNINYARSKLKNNSIKNISFMHGDTSVLKNGKFTKFDHIIISYVIHEMPESKRIETLKELKSIAKQLILSDYISPIPHNGYGFLTYAVEYIAGSDHFKNFKNYIQNGGIEYLAEEADLKIVMQVKNKKNSNHLAVLE